MTTVIAPVASRAASLIEAMRPRQWVKNGLVAAAPLAAGALDRPGVAVATAAAAGCFCAASSATYLLNDVCDAPADRRHPVKRTRPVAAGTLAPPIALSAAAILALGAAVASVAVSVSFAALVITYLAMQAAYTLRLKHQPVFDIAIVASGFLLRAIGGGLATGIGLSRWFLVVAAFGSLLMVSGKRYSELVAVGGDAHTRETLTTYTVGYLRFVWTVSAGVSIAAYCAWALEAPPSGPPFAELSIVPFVLGVLCYVMDVDAGRAGAPEDIVLGNRTLQVLGAACVALVALGAIS